MVAGDGPAAGHPDVAMLHFTGSTAHRMTRALQAGTVWVNTYRRIDWQMPFGGHKGERKRPGQRLRIAPRVDEPQSVWIESGR